MILVDMDGVLCDFVSAVIEAFGRNPHYVQANWKPGNYDVCVELGVSDEQMCSMVSEKGEAFWTGLAPYPWAKEMYDWLRQQDDVVILTQPMMDPCCLSGKLKWLYEFTGDQGFRNFLIGPRKDACARESNLLIDDSNRNVDEFKKACPGARTILFPQPWNRMNEFRGNKLVHVRYSFHKFFPCKSGSI